MGDVTPIFHPEKHSKGYMGELKATEAAVGKEFGLAPFLPDPDPFCSQSGTAGAFPGSGCERCPNARRQELGAVFLNWGSAVN